MDLKKNNIFEWMVFSCIVMLKICSLVALCAMHHEHESPESFENELRKKKVEHIDRKK